MNHSFFPNSEFGVMWHPRWGRVRTVVTVTQVNIGKFNLKTSRHYQVDKGAELLVDYGYDLIRCPAWYRDLWSQQIGRPQGLNYWEYRP